MRLNFWQWVGVALLAIGLLLYFFYDRPKRDANNSPGGTPATQAAP